jgi:hypothetical protein
MKVNFGKIAQLAEEQGTNLGSLSKQMGKNRYFLYNIRDRHGSIKLPDAKALAAILGTSVEFLADTTEDPAPRLPTFARVEPTPADISVLEFADLLATRPQTQVLFSALKNASDEDIAKVISILKVLKGETDDQ